MPVTPTGLSGPELTLLQDAKANNDHFILNIMTFDYYTGQTYNMATTAENAATQTVAQLKTLYPSDTTTQLYHMLGVTVMEGIDDYGPQETFTEADAAPLLNWAKAKTHHLDELSMWAIERDNGGCPGTKGAGTCSGISQPTWYFSQHFEPFTG
jgi:hypothetical protein